MQIFSPSLRLTYLFKKNNVYLLLRDRERGMGGAERGGDSESEGDSKLRAVRTETDTGLELTNPANHDLNPSQMLNRLSHPSVYLFFLTSSFTKQKILIYESLVYRAPGWLSLLSIHLWLRSLFEVCEFEPPIMLCADSSEPEACFGFCVSLFLCSLPIHTLSLCLSNKGKINI